MKKVILFLFWFGVISAEAADYTILDFGAKSDTTVLSTAALQQAMMPVLRLAEDGCWYPQVTIR